MKRQRKKYLFLTLELEDTFLSNELRELDKPLYSDTLICSTQLTQVSLNI
jgi:hypothetical protein